MKKILILILISFPVLLFHCRTTSPELLDGSISGTVLNNLTGEPIANASVSLQGAEQKTVATGSDGQFRFGQLTIGTYTIQASNVSFRTNNITVTLQSLEDVLADISLEPIPPIQLTPTNLDFGSDKTETNLVIKNIGNATITYEIQIPVSWVSVSKISGTLSSQNSDVLLVTVNRANLASGAHNASLIINIPGEGSENVAINLFKN